MPRKSHVVLPSLVRLSARQRYKVDNTLIKVQIICSTNLWWESLRGVVGSLRWFTRVSLWQQIDDLRKSTKFLTERPAFCATNLVLEKPCRSSRKNWKSRRVIFRLTHVDGVVETPTYTRRASKNILKKPSRSFALLVKQHVLLYYYFLGNTCYSSLQLSSPRANDENWNRVCVFFNYAFKVERDITRYRA